MSRRMSVRERCDGVGVSLRPSRGIRAGRCRRRSGPCPCGRRSFSASVESAGHAARRSRRVAGLTGWRVEPQPAAHAARDLGKEIQLVGRARASAMSIRSTSGPAPRRRRARRRCAIGTTSSISSTRSRRSAGWSGRPASTRCGRSSSSPTARGWSATAPRGRRGLQRERRLDCRMCAG